jgi:mono/diheme cytochrome c family protein
VVRPAPFVLACAFALAGAACSSVLPPPGAAEVSAVKARDPSARVENLEHGRSLYLGKCGGCHLLIEPAKFAADVWPEKVARMQGEQRVHLDVDEARDLVRYLVGASAVARGERSDG